MATSATAQSLSRVPGTQFAGITGTESEDQLNGTNTADTI